MIDYPEPCACPRWGGVCDVSCLVAAVELLRDVLAATPIGPCPGCGAMNDLTGAGQNTYCHACSVAELGEDPVEATQRRSLRMNRDSYARWRADCESRAARHAWFVSQNLA